MGLQFDAGSNRTSLLDLDENIKLSPKLIIETFIRDFLKTDKKIIPGFDYLYIDSIEDDDVLYVRDNWNDYNFIYVYTTKNCRLPSSICKPIRMKGKPVTFKMIKEYYGITLV